MSNDKSNWGQCKSCKMWQVEPDAQLSEDTYGLCAAHKLQSYQLRISGGGGCNIYKEGRPNRVKGSSQLAPPQEIMVDPRVSG